MSTWFNGRKGQKDLPLVMFQITISHYARTFHRLFPFRFSKLAICLHTRVGKAYCCICGQNLKPDLKISSYPRTTEKKKPWCWQHSTMVENIKSRRQPLIGLIVTRVYTDRVNRCWLCAEFYAQLLSWYICCEKVSFNLLSPAMKR